MTEQFLPLIREWRNRDEVRKFMYTRHLISENEHLEWWKRVNGSTDTIPLIFEYESVPMAFVSFSGIDSQNKNASWAFYLGPMAKRGIGSLVELLAIQYAFQKLRLHKLKCEVLAINQSVIKLHKKFGFSEEGLFKEEHFYETEFVDVVRLGLLSNDWAHLSNRMEEKMTKLWA